MAVPAGQKKLPFQTPNSNTPLVRVALDPTGLLDSQGKPITGQLTADGHITPAWRYLFGNFAQQAAAAAAAPKLISGGVVSLTAQGANIATATLFTPTVAGLYRVSMYLGVQTPSANAVGIAGQLTWNDGTSPQSATTSSLAANAAGFVSQTFVLYSAANQPVKYSVTIGGAGGIAAGTYMLQVASEQL